MELLDFNSPQEPALLIRQVLSEMDLDGTVDSTPIAGEFGQMLEKFREHKLYQLIASASKVFRELDFTMQVGTAILNGIIDLIFCGPDKKWHIVDYKSGRISGVDLTEKASRYELQMVIYAITAQRFTKQLPSEATLYFLREAETYSFKIKPESIDGIESRIAILTEQIKTARRIGKFKRRSDEKCKFCPYDKLCGKMQVSN